MVSGKSFRNFFVFGMFYAIFKVFGRNKVSLEDDSESEPVQCQTDRNFTIDDISDQLDIRCNNKKDQR